MEQFIIQEGKLQAVPSGNSSKNDFDFLTGKWRVKNRKLNSRLENCTEWTEFEASTECFPLLRGFANRDSYEAEFGGVPFEALTLRLFDPKKRLWSIYWADSNLVKMDVPQVGSFDGSIGRFYALDKFNGKDILVVFNWDKSDPEAPVWSQAFSEDGGETWEWNWYMYFERSEEK